MLSILETRGEVLLDHNTSMSSSVLARVGNTSIGKPTEQQTRLINYVTAELSFLLRCVENEVLIHNLSDGDITEFVMGTIETLPSKTREVLDIDTKVFNVDDHLFQKGFAVTLNREGEPKYRVYITQRHYFTC